MQPYSSTRSPKHRRPRPGEGGFTLIEALVAIVIVSIGLLGSAWLQIHSVRTTQNAYLQSQAAAITGDLADRIRANPDGERLGAYDSIDTANLPADPDCIDVGCTPAQLAAEDVREWAALVTGGSALLPSGSGTVSRSGSVYTVRLSWVEQDQRSAGEKAAEDADGVDSTQRIYEVRFSP